MRPVEEYVGGVLEARQIIRTLLWVYTTLPDDEADAFVLGFLAEKGRDEVAKRLHTNPKYAGYLLFQAIRKIKKGLLDHPTVLDYVNKNDIFF